MTYSVTMGKRTGRPRGRPPFFGKAMTMAERQQRSRWMRAIIGRMTREKAKRDILWFMKSPPDVVAYTIAFAHFDLATKVADINRWNEVDAWTRHHLAELEREFAD